MPYSANAINLSHADLELARREIMTKLVIIAEWHHYPQGRALAGALLLEHRVSDLFIEQHHEFVDRAAGEFRYVDHWLRSLVDGGQKPDLRNLPAWRDFKGPFDFALIRNVVPLSRLIEIAVSVGTRVHFVDNTNLKQGNTAGRDAAMAANMNRVMSANGGWAKCLLIVGEAHLPGLKAKLPDAYSLTSRKPDL